MQASQPTSSSRPPTGDAHESDEDVDRAFYTLGESEGPSFIVPDDKPVPRAPKRKGGLGRDQDEWETALLVRSGAAREDGAWDQDGEDLHRAQVIVRATRPSFLDQTVGLVKADMVDVVKDKTCDIAKAADSGSNAVRVWREKTAKGKMRHKYWELGGSQIGKAIGDKTEADYGQALEEDPALKVVEKLNAQGEAIPSQKDAAKVNQALPITRVLPDLLRTVREHQIVVVVGETGSGKTTRLPIALWQDKIGQGFVACTQPRRVAAMSVAVRVAEEYGTPVGQEIGYSIRFEDCTSNATRVKYMTDGVLLRESLKDPELERYACVVMDEAHERSLNTDILFGVLKRVVRARRDFHLVVTSATLDADRFAHFFGDCAIFRIPGRTFKVETYHTRSPVTDYVEAAVKQVLQIHLTMPLGDILVFMTGQEDITATCELVAERLEEILQSKDADANEEIAEKKRALEREQLLILPMYATLPSDMQMKIFQPAKPGQRKCVVSTNVAETSLTVDGIRYVVDSGFTKTNVYNPKLGMDSLRLIPVSRAAANQRAGRAGRTQEGFCYRLFTDFQFIHELLPSAVPEIQRTNLANVVLLLKSLGIDHVSDFDFMDPPPMENILDSMHQLWILGALDDQAKLTPLGRRMVEFPLDPSLSKMLLYADNQHCSSEVATVVSMLTVPDVFFRPPERQEESDAARERFLVPESDHLTLLNVYGQWMRNKQSAAWCAQHFIHAKAMRRAKEVREQIIDVMKKEGIVEREVGPTGWDAVRRTVCSSYFSNSARLKGVGNYVNMLSGIPCHLHPSSALFGLGYTPDYIVYHEMVLTTKEYMRNVTAVEGEWLAELGPMFFSLRGGPQPVAVPVSKPVVASAARPATTTATTTQAVAGVKPGVAKVPSRPPSADPLAAAREKQAAKKKKWG